MLLREVAENEPVSARVVLLAGPSGTGKSHLAELVGLPVVRLDDFYRDGDDEAMPRSPIGIVDWDDPRSWSPLIIAEGIFADQIVGALRDRGLLAAAICVRHHRIVTFVRRFQRDLREHRKPPFTLLRRGLLLLRDDPQVVRRCLDAGCEPLHPKAARRRIETLLTEARSR